jgi:hypothetical protein
MNGLKWLCATTILLIFCSAVWADWASEFAGFACVHENKVSGLHSTNGATKLPGPMFTLGGSSGTERVSYPSGIGNPR